MSAFEGVFMRIAALFVCSVLLAPRAAGAMAPPEYVLGWDVPGSLTGGRGVPGGIAAGPAGRIYVTEAIQARVLVYSPEGILLDAFGEPGTGPGQLRSPAGVTVAADGSVYVVDDENAKVVKYSGVGAYQREWGDSDIDMETPWFPGDVAVGPSGHVFLTERTGTDLLEFSAAGEFIKKIPLAWPADVGDIPPPRGISADVDHVYVVDSPSARVEMFDREGQLVSLWSLSPELTQMTFGSDLDVSGNLYVVGFGDHRIQVYGPEGTPLASWGEECDRAEDGACEGAFKNPMDVCVTPDGSIYVLEWGNSRVQKFAPATPVRPTTWGRLKQRYE